VIAVIRGHGPAAVREIVVALQRGGIRVVEVTMGSPDALDSIAGLAGDEATVGAGTVMTEYEAAAAIEAGAAFIVAPHTDPAVVGAVASRRVAMVPGATTPSEIMTAWRLGAAAVKLFPASIGGPAYLSTIRGPLGDVPIIPTGGVTVDSAPEYLAAGAVAVGLGGHLTSGDADAIQRAAAKLVAGVGTQ
jgi:2-dehydro-3-deoxyphosphogluconate aldolase/(4S)-4-hydroxy-2-oxoglutarate aldolase